MIATKTVEAALTQLQDRHQILGDELRQKAIEHAGLQIAIGIVQGLLNGEGGHADSAAEVVTRRPRRITQEAVPPKKHRSPGKGRTPENGDRNAQIMEKLNSGMSARETAKAFGVSVPTVYNVKSRMEKRQPNSAVASGDDDDDDEPAREPQYRPSEAPLKQPAFLTDTPLSPPERTIAAQGVESLLKTVRCLTPDQLMKARGLGPKQLEQVVAVANVELVDGKYQLKRRF